MLRFIVDTQLPPKLARLLSSWGFDAIQTTFFPNGHLLSDAEIIEIAIAEERIVITKDSDFLDNYLLRGTPPSVLLLQFGNIDNTELLLLFQANLASIQRLFETGSGLVVFDKSQVVGF